MFKFLRLDFDRLTQPRPEASNRRSLLAEGAALLHRSDESAYSIVPSCLSYRVKDRKSHASFESTDLGYRQLNIYNDLFTSRVYKRNYRPLGTIPPMRNRSLVEGGSVDSRSITPAQTILKQREGTLIAKQQPYLAELSSHDRQQGEQALLNEGSSDENTHLHDDREARASRNKAFQKERGLGQPCMPTTYQDHHYTEETYSACDLSPGIVDLPFTQSVNTIHVVRSEPGYEASVGGLATDARRGVSAVVKDVIQDGSRPTNSKDIKNDASSETMEHILVHHDRDFNHSTTAADTIAELEANPVEWVVQLSSIPYATSGKLSYGFFVNGPTLSYRMKAILGITGNYDIRRCVSRSKEEHLKMLLLYQPAEFADWRKYYFLESCVQGKADLVQMLLEYGIDVDLEYGGRTGPSLATRCGHIHVVQKFLWWAIYNDINIIESHKLLCDAVISPSPQQAMIQLLVCNGAKVDRWYAANSLGFS